MLIDPIEFLLNKCDEMAYNTNHKWLGKLGKQGTLPINGSESLLNMTLSHLIFVNVGLGNLLSSLIHHTILKSSTFDFRSILSETLSGVDMFKRIHSFTICYNTPKPSFMHVAPEPFVLHLKS